MKEDRDPGQSKRTIPPYLSIKTFHRFLESLKPIPSRIDRSIMTGISGTVQAQLIATLTYLRLVDSSGKPEDRLVKLIEASDELNRRNIKTVIVESAYPYLFGEFDLAKATYKQLQEKFEEQGTSGDTSRKAISFFLSLAREAGMKLSPHFKKKYKLRGAVRPKKAEPNAIPEHDARNEKNTDFDVLRLELMKEKFPVFDPSWPDEVKTQWFKSFNALILGERKTEDKQ